jgi:hypothetical protein
MNLTPSLFRTLTHLPTTGATDIFSAGPLHMGDVSMTDRGVKAGLKSRTFFNYITHYCI